MQFMRTTNTAISKVLFLTCFLLMLPLMAIHAETQNGDDAFREAVQAVKERDYNRALDLFEQQASQAKHDAQYNMAVLLQAGKGRPRDYSTALYWSWLAQLGGIDAADDITGDMLDVLTEGDVKNVRAQVGNTLQERLDNGDIDAISQYASYHLLIQEEPDYGSAYIWYSIAVALNIPNMADRRDDTERNIEDKELVGLQTKAGELFDKYNFPPFNPNKTGGTNDS
jgi:hypothetical protein